MRRQVVVREWYLQEVRKRAYLLWEMRQRATSLDDWNAAKVCALSLGHCRREEDIRRLADAIYRERLAQGPLDDWRKAEWQISGDYEIAA